MKSLNSSFESLSKKKWSEFKFDLVKTEAEKRNHVFFIQSAKSAEFVFGTEHWVVKARWVDSDCKLSSLVRLFV